MIQLLRNAVVYRDGAWRPSDILVADKRIERIDDAIIVNGNYQVVDDERNPIPGLYAAGAVTTLSYASVSTCMATGYYVGETLAAL